MSSDTTLTSAQTYKARQTEAAFQKVVVECAERHGWICVHWPNSFANPIWPDLTLIRNGHVIFAELKREDGTLSPKQKARLWELAAAGMEVYVWRPSAWEAIEMTLRGES